jgi:hypothetical protein
MCNVFFNWSVALIGGSKQQPASKVAQASRISAIEIPLNLLKYSSSVPCAVTSAWRQEYIKKNSVRKDRFIIQIIIYGISFYCLLEYKYLYSTVLE